jgi:hypothetical protein
MRKEFRFKFTKLRHGKMVFVGFGSTWKEISSVKGGRIPRNYEPEFHCLNYRLRSHGAIISRVCPHHFAWLCSTRRLTDSENHHWFKIIEDFYSRHPLQSLGMQDKGFKLTRWLAYSPVASQWFDSAFSFVRSQSPSLWWPSHRQGPIIPFWFVFFEFFASFESFESLALCDSFLIAVSLFMVQQFYLWWIFENESFAFICAAVRSMASCECDFQFLWRGSKSWEPQQWWMHMQKENEIGRAIMRLDKED